MNGCELKILIKLLLSKKSGILLTRWVSIKSVLERIWKLQIPTQARSSVWIMANLYSYIGLTLWPQAKITSCFLLAGISVKKRKSAEKEILDDLKKVTHFVRQDKALFAQVINEKNTAKTRKEITRLQKDIDVMKNVALNWQHYSGDFLMTMSLAEYRWVLQGPDWVVNFRAENLERNHTTVISKNGKTQKNRWQMWTCLLRKQKYIQYRPHRTDCQDTAHVYWEDWGRRLKG